MKLVATLLCMFWAGSAYAQAGDTPLSYTDYAAIAAQIDPAKHVIDLATFIDLRNQGAVVIDLRSTGQFGAGHLPGALHLESSAITANALAAIIGDPAKPVLIYCNNSLLPTRMIALTDIALPQFIAHGYDAVFMTGFMGLAPALADGRLNMTLE